MRRMRPDRILLESMEYLLTTKDDTDLVVCRRPEGTIARRQTA